MSGDRSTEFNDATGLASLSGIRFTEPGMVILKIGVTSDPAEYSLEKQTLINIRKRNVMSSSNNASQRIGLLFDADYDTVVGSRYQLQFQAMMGNYLSQLYPDIILNSIKIEKGQFSFMTPYIDIVLTRCKSLNLLDLVILVHCKCIIQWRITHTFLLTTCKIKVYQWSLDVKMDGLLAFL